MLYWQSVLGIVKEKKKKKKKVGKKKEEIEKREFERVFFDANMNYYDRQSCCRIY